MLKVLPGGHSRREPPDPIPNSEVKPLYADDSVGLPCESRSLPGTSFQQAPIALAVGAFCFAPAQ